MALKKTITVSGIEVVDAYHMVVSVGSSNPGTLVVRMGTFKSEVEAAAWRAAPRTAEPPITTWPFLMLDFDKGGANAHTQAYAHIKAQAAWSGATDV